MGDNYLINENNGTATWSILFRFFRLTVILTVVVILLYLYIPLELEEFYILEAAAIAISLIIYLFAKEVESIKTDGKELVITGRHFIFFKFTKSADFPKIKYKFEKPGERKKATIFGLASKTPRMFLYKNNKKWATLTGGVAGWRRTEMVDLAKTLVAKGCYNWFMFNKRK